MTELMKQYEDEQDRIAVVEHSTGKVYLPKYGEWLERKVLSLIDKSEAYDRLMSGQAAMTLKEIANFKGRPITVDADGAINAHGAEPHLARGGFAGYSDCWANDADDYEEIPESFVEIPEGFDWTTSLTLPDGWEEA